MDPITTAIVAAVSAGITDIGKKAFGDAYQGLKSLIKSKFGPDNKVSTAIAELEKNPESKGRQITLTETMAQEKADQDHELINIAEQLVQALKETDQGRLAVAKYQIDAKGAQIGVMGDGAKVEGGIHFGDSKK
jgi:hypothetical protein